MGSQTGDLGQPSHRHNTGTHIPPRHWPLSSTNTSTPLSYWSYNLPLHWERLGQALSEECGVSQPGGRQGPTLTQPAQHTDILNILYFRPAVHRQHHHRNLHSNNNNSCPSTERLKAANQREGLKVGTSVRSPLRDLLDTFLFYPRPSWSGWQSKVLAK